MILMSNTVSTREGFNEVRKQCYPLFKDANPIHYAAILHEWVQSQALEETGITASERQRMFNKRVVQGTKMVCTPCTPSGQMS